MDFAKQASVSLDGTETIFFIENEKDYVQRDLLAGRFYEITQLLAHRNFIPYAAGAVVVDVGANVGSHSAFYARHTRAERVIAFEANPLAASLLIATVERNSLSSRIDTSHL